MKQFLEPMEALMVDAIPIGKQWQYEPKWDGFRCLAFRRRGNIILQSKSGKPLNRYFPELEIALQSLSLKDFLLDGEIVIPTGSGLDFNELLQRLHPAASRVKKLAQEHPAHFMVFDVLTEGKAQFKKCPLVQRRARLEAFAAEYFHSSPLLHLSPATLELKIAKEWLNRRGTFLDGIMGKRLDLPYAPGKRTAMQKFKRIRTADCVVGGFRYATKSKKQVGSLLLGLYDKGLLNHVGFTSGIAREERASLLKKLLPLVSAPGFTGNKPGGPSRWSSERSEQWQPLKPILVVEVSYDHTTAGRFRHGTRLVRWRPDKAPEKCTLDQILVRAGKMPFPLKF